MKKPPKLGSKDNPFVITTAGSILKTDGTPVTGSDLKVGKYYYAQPSTEKAKKDDNKENTVFRFRHIPN